MIRLKQLDFLRGIAIILVLFRHIYLVPFTTRMGWIGVDLFFVLSGFLVSGLLFKEFSRFGSVNPKLFLIRRGFKIYPIYYLTYIIYLTPLLMNNEFNLKGFLADMTFTQNYLWPSFGYACAAYWSLAIEEHFYIGFALLFWFAVKNNLLNFKILTNNEMRSRKIEITLIMVLTLVFLGRLYSNYVYPHDAARNFKMTHLRIDSLCFGVLIAYFYHFRTKTLSGFYTNYKFILLFSAFIGLIWTPFIEPWNSFFAKTVGFSMLYLSFGIILIAFLFENEILSKINRIMASSRVVNLISLIGMSSYSIYIIHFFFVNMSANFELNIYLKFSLNFSLSIFTGYIMTNKLEKYFLTIREKYYPGRV